MSTYRKIPLSNTFTIPRACGRTYEAAHLCKKKDWTMVVSNENDKAYIQDKYDVKCLNMHMRESFLGNQGPFIWDHFACYNYTRELEQENRELRDKIRAIEQFVKEV